MRSVKGHACRRGISLCFRRTRLGDFSSVGSEYQVGPTGVE